MACRFHVVMGTSPDAYESAAHLLRSIDLAHASDLQMCVTFYSDVLDVHAAQDFVDCTRPSLAHLTLNLRTFDASAFVPALIATGKQLRKELLSPYNWFRFYLKPDAFPSANGIRHPILYLDTDTVVISDLTGLFTSLSSTDVFGAVPERKRLGEDLCANSTRTGIPPSLTEKEAINAGVLLMDLEAWWKRGVLSRWRELMLRHSDLRYNRFCGIYKLPGQTELQLIGVPYALLPRVYNVLNLGGRGSHKDWQQRFEGIRGGGKILHWNGPHKPWKRKNLINKTRWEQAVQRAWKDTEPPVQCHSPSITRRA